MIKYPNYLAGTQDDINKRLLQMILELQNTEPVDLSDIEADIEAIQEEIGTDTTANSIKGRIKALESAGE